MLMLLAVVVMVGGRGAGVSSLTPAQPRWRAGIPLALLMACIWHWSDCWSRAELRHCLVLPHLLRARVNPCILVLLPKASQHCAFIVRVCQEKVPSSMGEEGEKRGIVLFCWMDKCRLMKGATSPLPTVSLWEHCPAQVLRASKSPVPALRKNPTVPVLRQRSECSASPAVIYKLFCGCRIADGCIL